MLLETISYTFLSIIPMAGLEPASLSAPHFECGVSANSTTSAHYKSITSQVRKTRLELVR